MWCARRCRRMTRRAVTKREEVTARHTALVREGKRGSGLAGRRCGGAEALPRWATQGPTSFDVVCERRGRSAARKKQGASTQRPMRPRGSSISVRGRWTEQPIDPKWDNVVDLGCRRAVCGVSRPAAGVLAASLPRRSLRPPTMRATPTSCDRCSSTYSARQGACSRGPDGSQRHSGQPGARIRMVDAATTAEHARRLTPPSAMTAGSTSFDPIWVGFCTCSNLSPRGLWFSRLGQARGAASVVPQSGIMTLSLWLEGQIRRRAVPTPSCRPASSCGFLQLDRRAQRAIGLGAARRRQAPEPAALRAAVVSVRERHEHVAEPANLGVGEGGFGVAGHQAASAWAGARTRAGKSAVLSATAFRLASPSKASRRHSGMKLGFFQLSIVVSGKPVSRAISAEPPSLSMI